MEQITEAEAFNVILKWVETDEETWVDRDPSGTTLLMMRGEELDHSIEIVSAS